jgi:epoxyqueuosine reductase
LLAWLANGFHGEMAYMAKPRPAPRPPAELVPGTTSVITARMDYLPAATPEGWQADRIRPPGAARRRAIVSLYARGRDYHKVHAQPPAETGRAHRRRTSAPFGHRAFTDSAPVLEAELAARSGQGWRGKHTLVLNREAGSMFFLGEIYVDLALPPTEPAAHCGTCQACIDVCPTGAIVAPYKLDARRCISYLTIEHRRSHPAGAAAADGQPHLRLRRLPAGLPLEQVRPRRSTLPDFDARPGARGRTSLATLFAWSEAEFLRNTEGSPIRRIGHERWLRNIAVAMGNALRGLSG